MFVGFVVPETLRTLVGDGSGYANPTPLQWFRKRHNRKKTSSRSAFSMMNFLKPFQYLLEPDVFIILLFSGLHFTSYYCFLVTTTKQFSLHFQLTATQIGLCFLSQGGGTILGSFAHGIILDRDFKRTEKPDLVVPYYRARLRNIWFSVICEQVVTLIYGWCYYLNASLVVFLVLQFIGITTHIIMECLFIFYNSWI